MYKIPQKGKNEISTKEKRNTYPPLFDRLVCPGDRRAGFLCAVKAVCGQCKEQQYQASIFSHNIIKRHVRRGHFEYDQFVYDCKR